MSKHKEVSLENLKDGEITQIAIRYLRIAVPFTKIRNALIFLKEQTKAEELDDAMSLVYYKDISKAEQANISLVVTLWRAWKDGEVEPLINIEELYKKL